VFQKGDRTVELNCMIVDEEEIENEIPPPRPPVILPQDEQNVLR
jgi:hypothetical protein